MDGQWLTYMTWGKQGDIFIVRPDGSGQRQLTNDGHKYVVPRWAPDGSRIAFYSNRDGKFQGAGRFARMAVGWNSSRITQAPESALRVPSGRRIVERWRLMCPKKARR